MIYYYLHAIRFSTYASPPMDGRSFHADTILTILFVRLGRFIAIQTNEAIVRFRDIVVDGRLQLWCDIIIYHLDSGSSVLHGWGRPDGPRSSGYARKYGINIPMGPTLVCRHLADDNNGQQTCITRRIDVATGSFAPISFAQNPNSVFVLCTYLYYINIRLCHYSYYISHYTIMYTKTSE